jgi:hypothetical protein
LLLRNFSPVETFNSYRGQFTREGISYFLTTPKIHTALTKLPQLQKKIPGTKTPLSSRIKVTK